MTKHANRTQASVEARLAPAVALLQGLCVVMGVWALARTVPGWDATAGHPPSAPSLTARDWALWAVALVGWAGPTASDLRYWASHRKTSTGMILPAAASLALPLGLALWRAQTGALALAGWVRLALWLVLAGSCAAILLCLVWFGRLRRVFLHVPDVPSDAVVIVLGGTIRDGRPCLTLQMRLDAAWRLWQEEPARTFVLTGGPMPDDTSTEADHMARDLIARGMPADRLLCERRARNTAQNVRYSLDLLQTSRVTRTPCVLTSDYHLYRATTEGRACGVELLPIPCPTPPTSRLQQWCREVLAILF